MAHAVEVQQNGTQQSVPLSPGATVDFGKDPNGTVLVYASHHPSQARSRWKHRFFAIVEGPDGVFYKQLRGGPLLGHKIHLGRCYRLRSRQRGVVLLEFRVVNLAKGTTIFATSPLSPPAPSPTPPPPEESEDIEVDEVGGEEMQPEQKTDAPRHYGDRFTVDLARIAHIKLVDHFGSGDLDRHAVDESFWQLLVAKEAIVAKQEPVGGDDLLWQVPVALTRDELNDPGPEDRVFDFDTLGWKWVNFAGAKDATFADAVGVGTRSAEEASAELWTFIESRGLIVRTTR